MPNRFDDACVSTVALAEVYKPLVKDRHGWAVPERMARACDAEAGLAFDECRQRAALARLVPGEALAAAGGFVSETGSSAKSS